MPGKITIWENPSFSGRQATFEKSTGQLTGWEYRSASSVKLEGFQDTAWNAFFETHNSASDDILYIQGNGQIENLHAVRRPHGNNHWGDRTAEVRFGFVPNEASHQMKENSTRVQHGNRRYRVGLDSDYQLDTSNPSWGT